MLPILLIHGYSSEGSNSTVEEIYGTLPNDLRKEFGDENVLELNLSRWISLNNGITIDDISFAMNRALEQKYPNLLNSGFNVIIHSTGALVVRNWIKNFSGKPSSIHNLIHLAGANFGSGLAHIGQGQLARWGRLIFQGTGQGTQVLNELEFGSSKTLDMHLHFLQPTNSMYQDYQVQEFCLIGSQTLGMLRLIPIPYLKEDSSDSTVRTSAGNLNFNYITVKPISDAFSLSSQKTKKIINKRLDNISFDDIHYESDLTHLSSNRENVPFSVIFETAHFGGDIGIVTGTENRQELLPLIKIALETPYDIDAYRKTEHIFLENHQKTFSRATELSSILGWNKQQQYEAHAQVIFRIRDQYGNDVENFDITFRSENEETGVEKLEKMIEDKHINKTNKGIITFYFRTEKFENGKWLTRLADIKPVNVEVTGYEPLSGDISYLPMNFLLNSEQLQQVIQSFKTTIVDIELVRLPSEKVFIIYKQ
ncbi:MAG: hypothetical protein LUQ18_04250 [Methylococcaceae bacterium]|nr:hypothetical protein [Methylococcaceae bacterium]